MACGSCGGRAAQASNRAYRVTVGGVVVTEGGPKGDGYFESAASARIWVANNVTGQAATVKPVTL